MDKFEKDVSTGVLTFSLGLLDAFYDIEDEVMHTADWYVTSALLMICVWIIRDGFPLTFKWRRFRERKKQVLQEMERIEIWLLESVRAQILTNNN